MSAVFGTSRQWHVHVLLNVPVPGFVTDMDIEDGVVTRFNFMAVDFVDVDADEVSDITVSSFVILYGKSSDVVVMLSGLVVWGNWVVSSYMVSESVDV